MVWENYSTENQIPTTFVLSRAPPHDDSLMYSATKVQLYFTLKYFLLVSVPSAADDRQLDKPLVA